MNRTVNLSLTEAEVRSRCDLSGIAISAIEPLPAGGTHLVCTTGAGATAIREQLAGQIIAGTVRRFPFYRARGPW